MGLGIRGIVKKKPMFALLFRSLFVRCAAAVARVGYIARAGRSAREQVELGDERRRRRRRRRLDTARNTSALLRVGETQATK